MIRYTLRCADDHVFESWFQSVAAYDALVQARRVLCPTCGSANVEKSLMTPAVRPARSAVASGPKTDLPASDASDREAVNRALVALRRHVETTADYVGVDFAAEARAIHDGAAPERAIYGEARVEEAKRLIEDGIPVAPLPFLPRRKLN